MVEGGGRSYKWYCHSLGMRLPDSEERSSRAGRGFPLLFHCLQHNTTAGTSITDRMLLLIHPPLPFPRSLPPLLPAQSTAQRSSSTCSPPPPHPLLPPSVPFLPTPCSPAQPYTHLLKPAQHRQLSAHALACPALPSILPPSVSFFPAPLPCPALYTPPGTCTAPTAQRCSCARPPPAAQSCRRNSGSPGWAASCSWPAASCLRTAAQGSRGQGTGAVQRPVAVSQQLSQADSHAER